MTAIRVFALVTVLVYAALPIFELHFDLARPIKVQWLRDHCRPCAALGLDLADYYNRARPPSERAYIDTDPTVGNQ